AWRTTRAALRPPLSFPPARARLAPSMEKRVVFRSPWLPYALVAPQIVVTVVFFFWPAIEAVYYAFLVQDPFGLSSHFVWFQNFQQLFASPEYLDSFK